MGPGHTKTIYEIIKLGHLNEMGDGATVDYGVLKEKGTYV